MSPLAASPGGLSSLVPDPPRSEAPRLPDTACNTPCGTPSAALMPSVSTPSVVSPTSSSPLPFPWSKENALWYGRVSLVVAPGTVTDAGVWGAVEGERTHVLVPFVRWPSPATFLRLVRCRLHTTCQNKVKLIYNWPKISQS